jgi:outer membrane protein TolC
MAFHGLTGLPVHAADPPATTTTAAPAAASPADWRAANERVAKIGGWRTYARDTLPTQASPCALSAATPTAATATSAAPLTEAAAMAIAVAPRPWPPRAWQQAEGSTQRVSVDGDLVSTASRARTLWVEAVTAEAQHQLASRHYEATDAAADLATRLHAVGNLPLAETLHEQKAQAEAAIGCLEALHARAQARRALARQLNLDVASATTTDALSLPAHLPALPAAPLAAQRQRDLLARSNQADPAAPRALQLAAAQATYAHTWEVARRHQTTVLPLVEKLREESVLRYNGMLIGPDELLKVARDALDAERAALAALAAFWHADIALQAALMGHPESGD